MRFFDLEVAASFSLRGVIDFLRKLRRLKLLRLPQKQILDTNSESCGLRRYLTFPIVMFK